MYYRRTKQQLDNIMAINYMDIKDWDLEESIYDAYVALECIKNESCSNLMDLYHENADIFPKTFDVNILFQDK